MAKARKTTKPRNARQRQPDSAYFLKIVMYMVVGAQWVRLVNPSFTEQIPIPVGLIIGILFASHEHFKLDRKIEFAVLLVASFVGFWSQVGLYITSL